MSGAVALALTFFLATCATAAGSEDASEGRTPLATLDGETLYEDEVRGAVAFRIYRHQVDIYSLIEGETERRVDELLLAREAERRGTSVAELLEEVQSAAAPATDEEVERYLAEHPAEATVVSDEVRVRVRHYLTETRRIERRLALLEELRAEAGYRFLLPRPTPPRTEIDLSGAPARGPEDAPVTIVHFASFASRHSARSAANVRRLVEEFPGRIRWLHRNLFAERDERALLAGRLGLVAVEEGRFWGLHDRWFALGGKLDADTIVALARDAGLAEADVERARHDPGLLRKIKHDLDSAAAVGAPREPTLFVNGRYVGGMLPYAELRDVVAEELEQPPSGN